MNVIKLSMLLLNFETRREIAASLNDFSNRWCKQENVEPDALKEWKINILKLFILVFHFTQTRNTHPKSPFRHLK